MAEAEKNRQRAAAVIVVYHAEKKLLFENVQAVNGQADDIIVVINGSESAYCREYLREFPRIRYIQNEKNEGIARALNQGLEEAKRLGYEWALTLDQDSAVAPGFVDSLLAFSDKKDVGLIAPDYTDRNYDRLIEKKEGWDYDTTAITSGSLHNIEAWEKAGKYTEELFIDFVDYDFNAKLIRAGYKIIIDHGTILTHKIGKSALIKVLGKPYELLNEKPFRYYYIYRNAHYYYLTYPDITDVPLQKKLLFHRFILTTLYEKQGLKKFFAMVRGFLDTGKLIREIGNNRSRQSLT